LRARLENICGEWHFTATATGKSGLHLRSRVDPTQSAFPATRKRSAKKQAKEYLMLDVLMLALGFGFFMLAVGYTYACERL